MQVEEIFQNGAYQKNRRLDIRRLMSILVGTSLVLLLTIVSFTQAVALPRPGSGYTWTSSDGKLSITMRIATGASRVADVYGSLVQTIGHTLRFSNIQMKLYSPSGEELGYMRLAIVTAPSGQPTSVGGYLVTYKSFTALRAARLQSVTFVLQCTFSVCSIYFCYMQEIRTSFEVKRSILRWP